MELLLCLVEANAAAKSLASVSSHSLHAVEDCSGLAEVCAKVLPSALSILEHADLEAIGISKSSALECVQGLMSTMGQLQGALAILNEHQGEGVLGVLLEHPSAWLETYRGFRGITAQLMALSHLVRAVVQRRRDDTEEALQASLKALGATCTRARDAANLIGTDLPGFARSAVAAGWISCRVARCVAANAAAVASTAVSNAGGGTRRRRSSGGGSTTEEGAPASGTAAAEGSPAKRSILRHIGLGGNSGGSGSATPSAAAAAKQPSPSSPTSPASANSSPGSASPGGASSSAPSFTQPHLSSLEQTACALVARVQDSILYDSELDHLEQDRTYLVHRVERLREFAKHKADTAALSSAGGGAAGTAAAAALASLIQSEVLLAAVEARLAAAQDDGCGGGISGGAVRCTAGAGGCRGLAVMADGSTARAGSGRQTGGAGEASDLADGGDAPKRRGGMRWLPTCFVGA